MPKREIILIGGSAGSMESLKIVLGSLTPKLPAAVIVVIHLRARLSSSLPSVLQRACPLEVVPVAEGQVIENRKVYVAVPNQHVLVAKRHIHLSRGPREGLHRPSINATFRSAASSYSEKAVAVLLSGMLDDGAAGLWEIVRHNGVAIVQDPEEAAFPSMPLAALEDATVHFTLPTNKIGPLLNDLAGGMEVAVLKTPSGQPSGPERFSGFTCPECRGPLYEKKGAVTEFCCRVGHGFSLPSLLEEASSTQERKMYEAMVSLEEGADLAKFAAGKLRHINNRNLMNEAKQLRRQAVAIRRMLEKREVSTMD